MITLDTGTKLAVERTRLAQERTTMAWVRTAASLISFGFTIYKFFQIEQKGLETGSGLIGSRGFAVIMICTGVCALVIAAVQHHKTLQEMKESYGPMPKSVAGPVAWLVGLLGVLALVGVLYRV
jgi:putative membrane protein